jgi:hypothetical protein
MVMGPAIGCAGNAAKPFTGSAPASPALQGGTAPQIIPAHRHFSSALIMVPVDETYSCQAAGFKTPRGTAGAQIIAPELLHQFLVAMHNALAAFHLALGIKTRAGAYSSSHLKTLRICVPCEPPVANIDNKKPAGDLRPITHICGHEWFT